MLSYFDDKILVWPGAFSGEECEILLGRIDWDTKHGVVRAPAIARELGALAELRMPGAPSLRWTDEISISVAPVPWHLDEPRGATHKLCLYLDPRGVGTSFRYKEQEITPAVDVGAIVLFDIRLEHRVGEGYLPGRRVLGLRARAVSR